MKLLFLSYVLKGAIIPEDKDTMFSKRMTLEEEQGACGSIHEHIVEGNFLFKQKTLFCVLLNKSIPFLEYIIE